MPTYAPHCIILANQFFLHLQVRSNGLRVLNRAHSMSKRPVYFPLADLTRLLVFEDEMEVSKNVPF